MLVTCEICGKKEEVEDNYFDNTEYFNPEELYLCSDCLAEY